MLTKGRSKISKIVQATKIKLKIDDSVIREFSRQSANYA